MFIAKHLLKIVKEIAQNSSFNEISDHKEVSHIIIYKQKKHNSGSEVALLLWDKDSTHIEKNTLENWTKKGYFLTIYLVSWIES